MRQSPRSSDLSSRSHGEHGNRAGGERDISEKLLSGDEVTDDEPSSWATLPIKGTILVADTQKNRAKFTEITTKKKQKSKPIEIGETN